MALRKETVSPDSAAALSGAAQASSASVSAHLGFDATNVPCPQGMKSCTAAQSLSVMQAWMNSSPFYDIYIYLPHSPNRHDDPILVSTNGPSWVSSAENQGWGIGPIWFGLQSSCVITKTGISKFISTTPATASTEGAQQADSAVAQDKLLGITGGIIYLNIENYTTGGACSTAMQSYVDGFVSEIGAYGGFAAGVYANPGPINSDISRLSPAPAAIWIANANKQVTIWNQGISDYSSTSSSMSWPNRQRMHQFVIDPTGAVNATWGGSGLAIDYDIDNGPVVNANKGAKSYTLDFSTQNFPGALYTNAYGINDIWGDGIINGSGEVGQIVGGYHDSQGVGHGFLLDALAQWSPVDCQGQIGGSAFGINNLGQIVGVWEDSNHCSHGYQYSGGKCTLSYDHPSAVCAQGGTAFTGINDAGQITGIYYDNTGWHTFLYYQKQPPYPVNYQGATYTTAWGINGDGMIAGTLSPGGGFVESPIPPSWTGNFSTFIDAAGVQTFGEGINNDGDVAGYYEVQYLDDFGLLYTNNVQLESFQYPMGYDTYVYGVNDFGQIVGYSNNPGMTNYQAVVAVPQ